MENLEKIRKEINDIDNKLVQLFEKRMKIVNEVAKDKIKTGKKIYDSKREQEVVNRAINTIKDKKLSIFAKEFFENLMDVSRQYQQQLIPSTKENKVIKEKDSGIVGFQGTKGSFSDYATDFLYDNTIKREEFKTFEDLFKAIQNNKIKYGVVPIENTSTGGVKDVLNLLRTYNLYITSQFDIKIEHCLLGVKGSNISEIKHVYSHPQALMQCAQYFKLNSSVVACPYLNTAIAAKDVSNWNDPNKGAIASKKAAKLYNLEILVDNLQDNSKNITRFITISNKMIIDQSASKTSIIFTTSHIPGSLFNVLKIFSDFDINITRIESRPNLNRKFEYYFYLDFLGTINMINVKNALEQIKNYCGYYKILGSYAVKGDK